MKTLMLLRHAKSSWDNPDLSDFSRPLNPRGLEAATYIGTVIYNNHLQPDLIISSPAKRAKQTAVLVKETSQTPAKIHYEEKVYEASPLTLLQVVAGLDDAVRTVLLVGHNPGMEGFIKLLTDEAQTMTTATLVKINLYSDKWSEVSASRGTLEMLIRPKKEGKKSAAE